MATTPTQKPVPSESPIDLKYNAGKIDEFVTSMGWTYIDRFGNKHYTIEGLRWLAQQAISQFGYITLDSFEDGNTLTLPNQVLRLEATGEYYRWDGPFPKVVSPDSTPESTGGIGPGAWLSVGDASLRTQLGNTDGFRLLGECPDVATLRQTEPKSIGQLIRVKSYYSDIKSGGDRFFRSVDPAGKVDNGGTIIVTNGGSVWQAEEIHDITLEDFGARSGVDATDALRRAVNSPATRITSNLSEIILTDNSVFTRSNISIDMPDTVVLWNAATGHVPERESTNYRFPGIIAFRGSLGEIIDTRTLTGNIFKGDTTYQCNNNALFNLREWIIMQSDVGSGTIGREVNVMSQVLGSGGASNQLRVDYKTGWNLPTGRSLTYRRVTPLENIKVHFKGVKWNQVLTVESGTGDEWTSEQACALLSLEYVVDADICLGDGEDHPYPMVVTSYVNRVRIHDTRTLLPRVPGSDHVVQFNNAYRCTAERLVNVSGRHTVDFTGASYCSVEHCGETGSRNGSFTTHGVFEHNLRFDHCYGLLSFANSGSYYGESADMITATHHFGDFLIASAKVTNLTVKHAIFTKGARVNNDAATLIDVTVGENYSGDDKGLRFVQSSAVYGRGAKIIGGDVIFNTQASTALPDSLSQPVTFDNVYVRNFNNTYIGGTEINFNNCDLIGSSSALENLIRAVRFNILGGRMSGTGFNIDAPVEQFLKVHDATLQGSGASGANAYFNTNKDTAGDLAVTMSFKNNIVTPATGTKAFRLNNAVGIVRLNSTGNTFQGGSIEFQTSLPTGSWIYHTGNVERGVTRLNDPTNTQAVITTGNMIL
ncbi:hypothetical protein M4B86_24440 [Klebsiella pneumoniae]|nr:hypothetical protein [Klebsiella pneumoniae]